MKITANPKFEMRFELPLEAIVALSKCSVNHYDSRCKEASQTGGFIAVWRRTVENAQKHGWEPEITATTSNLDMSLKIMEMASYEAAAGIITTEEHDLIHRTRVLFMSLFRHMNRLYEKSVCVIEEKF